MNLYRKDIGVPFINETVSGVYPYQYNTVEPEGWDDITNIINNDLFGHWAADYVRATKEMSILFEAKECTTEEKKCLSKRMIIDQKSLRLTVFTPEDDALNFQLHADNSIGCRQARIDAVKIEIGYLLSVADRVDLFTTVALMLESYINVNDTSLSTWMHSADGFLLKPYYTEEIETIYTNIVELGLY
jgi:hypothetical protein